MAGLILYRSRISSVPTAMAQVFNPVIAPFCHREATGAQLKMVF